MARRRTGWIGFAIGFTLVTGLVPVLGLAACKRLAPATGAPAAAPTAVATATVAAAAGTRPPVATEAVSPTAIPDTTVPPESTVLPDVPGLSGAQARSLASLQRVDDYPLYTMHLYADDAWLSAVPVATPASAPAWGCSLFAAFGAPDQALYGRNFDWNYSPALLLFSHPADGYAAVTMVDLAYLFPADELAILDTLPLAERAPLLDAYDWPFDGMNAAGLTVGMAAVHDSALPHDPALPTLGSLGIIRAMLDRAGTVEEALNVMRGYNIDMEGGPALHYLIADASGASRLVEYYEGEMAVLPNTGTWQAATNHYRTPLRPGDAGGCWRYATLDERLTATGGRLQVDEALALLGDVAQDATQWSVVYDMAGREVHVVMGKAYRAVHTFGLDAAGE